MKSFLKFGVALILFGLLLSALGVGIIRANAVKPSPAPTAVAVTGTDSASVPTSKPTSP